MIRQRYFSDDNHEVTAQIRRLTKKQGLVEPSNVLAYKYDEPGSPARFLTEQKEIWPRVAGAVPPPVAYAERFWSQQPPLG